MLSKISVGVLLLVFHVGIHTAFAQDRCAQVLQFGIWDTQDTSESTLNSQKVANWACSASSRSDGGGFSYGGIGVNASSSSGANSCSRNQSGYIASHEFNEAIKTASRAVVEKWEECINSFGSHASILYRDDLRQFSIILTTKTPSNSGEVARISSLYDFKCTTPRKELAHGVFYSHGMSISCERPSVEQPISIDVNYSSGYPGQALYIPATQPKLSINYIENRLIGSYQVHIGPKGGCMGPNGPKYPTTHAQIYRRESGLAAMNECGNAPGNISRVTIGGEKIIYWWSESARINNIRAKNFVITDDAGNSWEKLE
jgi:hypothetical protein